MTRNILDRMKTSEVVERVEEKINQGAKVKRKEWTKKEGAAPVCNPDRAGSPRSCLWSPGRGQKVEGGLYTSQRLLCTVHGQRASSKPNLDQSQLNVLTWGRHRGLKSKAAVWGRKGREKKESLRNERTPWGTQRGRQKTLLSQPNML